jgi:HEPN domain-containing protein
MTPDKSTAPNVDTSEDEVFETRLPKTGDRLFMESTWAYDAQVVRDPKERFYRMPMGYKRAGDLLIDQASANVMDRSNVIYAALFCYRQAIELYLKSLIAEFGETGKYPEKHELRPLWDSFKEIVNARGAGNAVDLRIVELLILEMDEADQHSYGFRYPATKTKNNKEAGPFDFGDRGIDLPNIREVMQGLANFFECTSMEFSHRDDFSSDQ